MTSFSAQVKNWTEKAKRNTRLVFVNAVQMMARELSETTGTGGLVPYDTGNLRRSFMASTSSLPAVRPDVEFNDDPMGSITLTIAGLKIGDTVYLGWQAAYAMRLNYGFTGQDSFGRTYNQAGLLFAETAASNWDRYVQQSAAEIG